MTAQRVSIATTIRGTGGPSMSSTEGENHRRRRTEPTETRDHTSSAAATLACPSMSAGRDMAS